MGGDVFPPCCLPGTKLRWRQWRWWRPPSEGPIMHCCTQCSHPEAAHRWPTPPLLDTPSESGSVSCVVTAPFSCVLVHTGSVCALQESVPQSCVSSGRSMVGLMVTSSKRAYATPKSAAPGSPPLWQATADPYLHMKHSNTVPSQSLWSLWVLVRTRFV